MQNESLAFFPFDKPRPIQSDMIEKVYDTLQKKGHLIVHAPTGLGKTAASLSPAVKFALDNDKTIFFLTSRHTQHKIAVDTLKAIKEKGADLKVIDITGKRTMCVQKGAQLLLPNEFNDFCKTMKEEKTCVYSNNMKQKNALSEKAKKMIERIKFEGPMHSEDVIDICRQEELCPYEILMAFAKKANVIIADYYYLFNPRILETVMIKTKKEIEDCIIIVDEGHNLGNRVRELMTTKISTFNVLRASKEARKFGTEEDYGNVMGLGKILHSLSEKMDGSTEVLIQKKDFVEKVKELGKYEKIADDLEELSDEVKKLQKKSSLAAIANFLKQWDGEDEGYARILEKVDRKGNIILTYRCLDPGLFTSDVISNSHSTILMSGTLTPTNMYSRILGFPENTEEQEYTSPFPQKNRLNIIIPKTTTKFSMRTENMFKNIAGICAGITNIIPGNTALFFPSYDLRDRTLNYYSTLSEKTIISEVPSLTKTEKKELIDKFISYSKTGSVLTCAASGSFGEGIDLPGDYLKAVIIVGLPLQVPDLETKKLIEYYDKKFNKGWDFGYVLPAITKVMQNAGRCIRTEEDKGVIVFLDERYAWKNYLNCFPKEWEIQIRNDFQNIIKGFLDS